MKVLNADKEKIVVEFTLKEREMIDCLFSMVNCMDHPNWGATEDGYGNFRLDEQKFDALCDDWRSLYK